MSEFAFLLTPLGIVLLAIVVVTGYLHIATTSRALGDARAIHAALLQQAKQRAHRRFSVIISLKNRAETIIPLLDHLASHHYEDLEVIVVMYQTSGRNARSVLERYRRIQKFKNLRLITHKAGFTDAMIAKRYAKGTFLLRLEPGMRLTPNFFIKASYALATGVATLSIRRLRRPEQSIVSGFGALSSLWRSVMRRVVPRRSIPQTGLVSGTIVSRDIIMNLEMYTPRSSMPDEYAIDITHLHTLPARRSWYTSLFIVCVLLGTCAALFIAIQGIPLDILQFIGLVVVGLYLVSTPLLLFTQKGLRRLEVISLTLLIPLYPFWLLVTSLTRNIWLLLTKAVVIISNTILLTNITIKRIMISKSKSSQI